MSPYAILAAILVCGALLGLAMTGSPARRATLMAIATCALAIPFLVVEERAALWYRALLVGSLQLIWIRLYDLAMERRPPPPVRRLLHAIAIVEMRRTARVPRILHLPSLVRVVVLGAITVAGYQIIATTPPSSDYGSRALVWSAAVVASYTSLDTAAAFAMLQWRALGFAIPVMHDDPIKSRTIAEFWSQRWNRTVGGWLREHCFRPLVRRRLPTLAILTAFAATTVIHVYLAWGAFDFRSAAMWALFFGLQAPIVLLERKIRVASWPTPLARLWTIGVLLCISPLFVEPLIRAIQSDHG